MALAVYPVQGAEPQKILTKWCALEQFSRDLEIVAWWALGAEPVKNFDKIVCF